MKPETRKAILIIGGSSIGCIEIINELSNICDIHLIQKDEEFHKLEPMVATITCKIKPMEDFELLQLLKDFAVPNEILTIGERCLTDVLPEKLEYYFPLKKKKKGRMSRIQKNSMYGGK